MCMTHFISKATPTNNIDYVATAAKELKVVEPIRSILQQIAPLVINSFEGRHTDFLNKKEFKKASVC